MSISSVQAPPGQRSAVKRESMMSGIISIGTTCIGP